MEQHINAIQSFLDIAKELNHISLKFLFLKQDNYHSYCQQLSKTNNKGAIAFEINDVDKLKHILPHPYNKKSIFETLNKGFIYFPYGKHFDNIKIIIEVGPMPDKTNNKYNDFKSEMITKKEINEYLHYKSSSKFTGTLASKTGMENVIKNIIEEVAFYLDKEVSIQSMIKDNTITDPHLSDDDYLNLLYTFMIDAKSDLTLIKDVFNHILSVQYINVDYDQLKNLIIYTKLRYQISDLKIKTLLGYILKSKVHNESVLTLLNSSIPDRYIISKQTPYLHLKTTQL